MIEVITRLTQGAYLAGDQIECGITFRSPSPPADAKSQWNEQEEVLALATVQIYCQVRVSSAQVNPPLTPGLRSEEAAVTNSRTSFAPLLLEGHHGHGGGGTGGGGVANPGGGGGGSSRGSFSGMAGSRVVSATKPTILFCDLRLLPGESKTFWYRETLPVEGPPSFRGQSVRYTYKLVCGTQRINSPIKLLHVPIRVLVLQEFTDSAGINGSEDLSPTNPFLSDQGKESHIDSALQILQVVTSQRNQKFYNVTNSRGHVVKFCTFKQAYKLGEDIVGSLDFSESTVPCLQYAVSLQSTEEVTPECRKSQGQKPVVSSYTKYHEMVIGYQQTHFVLPIPLHVTPSFYTDLIHLKWRLHFEFVTSTAKPEELSMRPRQGDRADDMDGQFWQGPSSVPIETMVWDLPIKLYPNLPLYLSQGLQMQTKFQQRI